VVTKVVTVVMIVIPVWINTVNAFFPVENLLGGRNLANASGASEKLDDLLCFFLSIPLLKMC
jgi:hypothetical protein